MNNRIRTVISALALVILVQSSVLADPLSDQLQTQQNQLQQDKKSLKDAEDKRADMEIAIEHLDHQIVEFMNQVQDNKKQIVQSEKDIITAEVDVKKAEDDVAKQQEMLDKRVRAMYINGQASYLKLLFQAEGFSDLVSTVETIKSIISFDKKTIETLNLKKIEVDKKKIALEQQRDKLLALKADNEKKLASLSEASKSQNKLIDEVKKQERIFASKVSESQTMVNSTLKQIDVIRKAAPNLALSRGAAPISNNSIIAYATNFLGTNYVWGGTTPNPGFDCSGFTKYVYAHFGVKLGRTTYDQINNGIEVSRDQLQAGDLVFFGSWGNPHHMGIYIANNTYIHAPRTGDVIKVSAMTRSDYVTARRVK